MIEREEWRNHSNKQRFRATYDHIYLCKYSLLASEASQHTNLAARVLVDWALILN